MCKIFLVCFYSYVDVEVVEQCFCVCNEVVVIIVCVGYVVFSQVFMFYLINLCLVEFDCVVIGRLWVLVDVFYMDYLEELIVFDLLGW